MRLFPSLFRLPSKLQRRARRSRMAALTMLFVVLLLFFTPFYIVYKPPSILIRYLQYRWPDVLWHVPTSSKLIALTIDDAPSEQTGDILQVLQEYNATATFFVIGSQVAGREAILQEILLGGHELGNHAMYDEPSRGLSEALLESQISDVQTWIDDAYHAIGRKVPSHYFRPGSGFFNSKMRTLVKQLGYRLVLGSIYPHDPQIQYAWVNARHISSMARGGGIIICHDRRRWTAPMLRKVLPKLQKRGYRVVTISRLLEEARP